MPIIKGSFAPINITGGVDISNEIKRTIPVAQPPKPVAKPVKDGEYMVFTGEDFGSDFSEGAEEAVFEGTPSGEAFSEASSVSQVSAETAASENEQEERPVSFKEAEGEAHTLIERAKDQAAVMLAEARQQADAVRNEMYTELAAVQADCERHKNEAKKLAEELKRQAEEQGFAEGREEGLAKGQEEGYVNGLKKCRDTLLELKKLSEDMLNSRDRLVQGYERQIFDLVFAIAQKITVDSLKQKDKKVLEKMIKEAAKEMRQAKTIRVTLSKLDLSEDIEADFKRMESLFSPTANIEFEVLGEAESGTLILDDGSQIIDAGVSTQLRMIKELGLGRYRDAAPSEDAEEFAAEERELAEVGVVSVENEPVENEIPAEAKAPAQTKVPAEMKALTEANAAAEAQAYVQSEEAPQAEIIKTDEHGEKQAAAAAEAEIIKTDEHGEKQAAAAAEAAAAEEKAAMELLAENKEEKPAAEKKKSAPRKRKPPTNPLLSKMLGELTEE